MQRFASTLAATVLVCAGLVGTAHGQKPFEPPRTPAGKPDFTGVWQVMNRAHYNIEPHPAQAAMDMKDGPVVPIPVRRLVALGAVGAVPAGIGVVAGGRIPYTDAALKQRAHNRDYWLELDPEIRCYLPGVPRATYMPFPFQIFHTDQTLFFSYEYAGAVRNIHLSDPGPAPVDSWMGQSWARWEGDTLVIETTGQNERTWLDRAGNHHSAQLKVTERYTHTSPYTIDYQVTLEDPAVYTEPWQMRMNIYRRVGADARIMQFNCVEFVEQLLYRDLRATE